MIEVMIPNPSTRPTSGDRKMKRIVLVQPLATIAANVGVAIQNARLFSEIDRQTPYFEMLVEGSPAAVVGMDADERVTGWNPAAAALFGYAEDEARRRSREAGFDHHLVKPLDLAALKQILDSVQKRAGR